MSVLKIPVTATVMPEWVRRCADAVNGLISGLLALTGRVSAVEGRATTLEGQATALEGRADAVEDRATALEAFTALPFAVNSIRLKPVALPSSPTKGTTVYDTADDTVKTWNGTIWKAHY